MPLAVTLPLDTVAAAGVERIWRGLAERANDDDALRLGYIPHITLAVLSDPAPVAHITDIIRDIAKSRRASEVTIAALGVFPGTPPVIWASPSMTQQLLTLHSSLYEGLAPFSVHPHYHPGQWVPHVTLSKQGQSSVARALDIITSEWHGPVRARLERIELVRFRPVELLQSEIFSSE